MIEFETKVYRRTKGDRFVQCGSMFLAAVSLPELRAQLTNFLPVAFLKPNDYLFVTRELPQSPKPFIYEHGIWKGKKQ